MHRAPLEEFVKTYASVEWDMRAFHKPCNADVSLQVLCQQRDGLLHVSLPLCLLPSPYP